MVHGLAHGSRQRSSDGATSAWAATAATDRNCSGGQLGGGGCSHVGLQALAGLQAHCGTDGKGYGGTAYGRVVSLADWEPSGKGDGIGGCVFFVSTAGEVR